MQRVGIGYDIHRLEKNRNLILGNIKIPYEMGLVAHSDGDVLIHAIIDSLLGAMGEKDIGSFFPDTDMKYKNISSRILLEKVVEILDKKNMKIVNIDTIIVAERPKLSQYIDKITLRLAEILEIDESMISVKATTNERIGDIGDGKAILSFAISSIENK